jgi:hypothetical protein
MPLSYVRYGDFPVKIVLDKLPIPPDSNGIGKTGEVTPQPALLVDSLHRCNAADKAAATCLPWKGFSILGAVRDLTGKLQDANGLSRIAHAYGSLSKNRHVGGGVGGGNTGSGDDYALTFNHEAGHMFDMGHWRDNLYSNVTKDDGKQAIHPYTGQYIDAATNKPEGGGFGNNWAYDALDGTLLSPTCEASGKERQDPMWRRDGICFRKDRAFDHYGDYSALSIHRYFVGASKKYEGNVSSPRDSSGNVMPPFRFPDKSGRPNWNFGDSGGTPKLVTWNEVENAYTEITPESLNNEPLRYGEMFPLTWDVPVYTLWGSFSTTTPGATTIQSPLKYRGNLKRVWDPTKAEDFAIIRRFVSSNAFYYGADLVVQAEFDDGTSQRALIREFVRGQDPLKSQSYTAWAVNIPAPKNAKLKRVSLFHRPMEVRNRDGGDPVYNLNHTNQDGLTADHYLDSAKLVSERTF